MLTTMLNSLAYAGAVDKHAYYASRRGQIFKSSDIKETSAGYVRGDEMQYLTWDGYVSGLPVYVEIHGENLKIHIAKKIFSFAMRKAPSIPGGDKEDFVISDVGSVFYVKSTPNPKDSAICIEALGPDIYVPLRPYWEVYLITNPLTSPKLFRLSGINSSCSGIERTPEGKMIVPKWTVTKLSNPNVIIDYYFIEKDSIRKSNIQVTGKIASDDALEYLITDAP